jgi:arginase family enzyme
MQAPAIQIRHVVAAAVTVLVALTACGSVERSLPDRSDDRLVPRWPDDRLLMLEPDQREFIDSGAVLKFVPARQLEHELATRAPESFQRFISDLMQVAGQLGYDPKRDMGAIPLNLSSKRFNTLPTPEPLRPLKRSPGPFSVHRYLFPESGIPTFAGAKVAIWPEDLVAGSVDVAIMGIPNNMSSGRRDAGRGPLVMRALNTMATPDVQTLLNPLDVLSVVDYGDIFVDIMSTERTIGHVAEMVAATAATGAVPVLVGGDTSMLFPGVEGVARHHGHRSFGLVHFSAHPDVHRTSAHTISDTQAVYRLLDEGIVAGNATILVGLRGNDVSADSLEWLRAQQVRYHTMASIGRHGDKAVLQRVLMEAERGPDKLFVSIDVSVIDPSQMVAAGRIAANGLGLKEVLESIRHLCAAREIVGFEITDMAPMLDYSRLSALNANAIINACLVGMAARRAGLSPDHIHPLSLDHGQD